MRKTIATLSVAGIAMAAILLIAKGVLDNTTGKARTAAEARLVARLDEAMEAATALEAAESPVIFEAEPAPPQVPGLTKEELKAAWDSLFRTWETRLEDKDFRRDWNAFMELLNRSWEEPRFPDDLTEEDWTYIEQFLDRNADIQTRIEELTKPGQPALVYVALNYYPFYAFDRLIAGHLQISFHQSDMPAYMTDFHMLSALYALEMMPGAPESFEMEIPMTLDSLLHRKTLDTDDLDTLSGEFTWLRRRTRLVEKCVATAQFIVDWYGQMPRGSGVSLAESPTLHVEMWGYRYGLTSLMNSNMVRFSKLMDPLLDLTPRPYYEIKPALDRFIEEHKIKLYDDLTFFELTPTEVFMGDMVYGSIPDRAYFECKLDQYQLAIALARYRGEHGADATSLEALGKPVPRNSWTGDPHRYQVFDGHPALWFEIPHDDGGGTHVLRWPGRNQFVPAGEDVTAAIAQALEKEAAAMEAGVDTTTQAQETLEESAAGGEVGR